MLTTGTGSCRQAARPFFHSGTAACFARSAFPSRRRCRAAFPSFPVRGVCGNRISFDAGVSFQPLPRTFLRRQLLALEKPGAGVAARLDSSPARIFSGASTVSTADPMLRIVVGYVDRFPLRHPRLPLRVPLASAFPISRFSGEPVRAPQRSRWPTRAGSSPHGVADTNFVSCSLRSRSFFRRRTRPLPRPLRSPARAPRPTSLPVPHRAGKIPGDGLGGEPVPGPQRRPVPLPVGAAVAPAVPARPPDRPSVRVPCSFAGRFAVPAQTPPGFIPSLCRDTESFVVCSFLFSHFYARRRFLSHPTHLWCPQRQMRARPALPCHSTAKWRLAAAGNTCHRSVSSGYAVGIR